MNFYRPQRSCESYAFTPVRHSVHRGWVCLSACWDSTPPPPGADIPSGADTPPEQTLIATNPSSAFNAVSGTGSTPADVSDSAPASPRSLAASDQWTLWPRRVVSPA